MRSLRYAVCTALAFGAVLMAPSAPTRADVMLRQQVSVEGTGLMSFANMNGTSTTAISGMRARMDSDMQMQSRLVRAFARGMGPTSTIVLLNADKLYEIDVKKREYRELSLTEQREQLQKAMNANGAQGGAQPAPTGMDESQCEWSDPKVDVRDTGNKATVAGFAAQQMTVVARQSCKDKKTGAICDVALALDEWIAPGFDMGDEARQFNLAYAKQIGLATAADESMSRAQMFFSRYKGAWDKVTERMREVKGYPVKSSFALGFGGAACMDKGDSGANGTSSSSSSAPPSDLGAQIAGALFGGRKKSAAQEPAAAAPATTIPGMEDLFVPMRVHSELLSASHDSLPASTFEVPAGFKKTTR
jgi:hypothetical protein